ncbi:hypothetical protein SAMN04488700_0497 [Carnobacterium iners]|uniref:Lipoprotein n=1 Tax=Carnobacterium iners TaxID=1073423 RepID=A0A1X7MQS6_9LACT|nr:hypothetical protein [Carnobacterium iners]SEL00537.1 hypothetical protein SAMN04488114_12013 [Carnobacterium iners]SMH27170.1 hypothetical protein SAMN04488700_0497 [Carnobacterium iners]
MIRKLAGLLIVTTGLFVLTACDEEANSTLIESSTNSSELVEIDSLSPIQSTEDGYRKNYNTSLVQFESGKLDEAAGTIEIVLENDLTDYPELETQVTELKTKINTAQADKVKKDKTSEILEDSAYKTERVSDLAATEFNQATDKDIKTVSDQEIKTWLVEKEATESSETLSSESTSSSITSEKAPVISPEEERIMVLEKIIAMTGISAKDNQFYSSKEDKNNYQIEIRHAHEVDGIEISNMVGMFKYDISTNTLTKMDPITGKYNVYMK